MAKAPAPARLPIGYVYWIGETEISTRPVRQQLGRTLATTTSNARRWATLLRLDPASTLHIWGAKEGQPGKYLASCGRETAHQWRPIPGVIKELPIVSVHPGADLSAVQIRTTDPTKPEKKG